tara:strand:+ start:952 stop:1641 length:690 start_codon:yes stop_codon:yes gene_type:complete
MKYKNLTIIGTSHISKESMNQVENFIEKQNPTVVALELDKKRAYALMHDHIKRSIGFSDIRRIGFKGYLFSLIGAWAEKKLGDMVGVSPGDEMKTALKLIKKNNLKVAYIDQDIDITLKRFSKTLTWKEKWNFIVDLFRGFVLKQKTYTFDLNKVPSKKIVDKMIKEVKVRYPNLYLVLVKERNIFMAKKLMHLIKLKPEDKILAIVGAGHEEEMIKLIKKNINKFDAV